MHLGKACFITIYKKLFGVKSSAAVTPLTNHIRFFMLDCGKITIGNHVFLAPHVQLYTVNHPIHLEQRDADYEYTKPITIKDHVWIGGNSTVLPGVTIGENSIIGAGSVVTKDIPANVIAVGNPCRILRELTKEELGLS